MRNFRHALVIYTTNGGALNANVETAGCRPLDLRLPPFDLAAAEVYQFGAVAKKVPKPRAHSNSRPCRSAGVEGTSTPIRRLKRLLVPTA